MKEIILFSGEVTNVDDEYFDMLSKYKWYNKNGYAVRYKRTKGKLKCFRMHRQIMGAISGQCIDHIDRNPLNNLKNNLRFVSFQENSFNRSVKKRKFKGVYLRSGNYRATIKFNKKYFYLGTYKTDIAAAYAYNKKAKSLSDFYCLNNLDFSETELENMLKNEVVIK